MCLTVYISIKLHIINGAVVALIVLCMAKRHKVINTISQPREDIRPRRVNGVAATAAASDIGHEGSVKARRSLG